MRYIVFLALFFPALAHAQIIRNKPSGATTPDQVSAIVSDSISALKPCAIFYSNNGSTDLSTDSTDAYVQRCGEVSLFLNITGGAEGSNLIANFNNPDDADLGKTVTITALDENTSWNIQVAGLFYQGESIIFNYTLRNGEVVILTATQTDAGNRWVFSKWGTGVQVFTGVVADTATYTNADDGSILLIGSSPYDSLFVMGDDIWNLVVGSSGGVSIEQVRAEVDTIPGGLISIGTNSVGSSTSSSLFLRRYSAQTAQSHIYIPPANNPKLQICNGCTWTGEFAGNVLNNNQVPAALIMNNGTINPDFEFSFFNKDIAGAAFTSADKVQLMKIKWGNNNPSVSIGNVDPLTGTKLRVRSDAATSAASALLVENNADTMLQVRNDGLLNSQYYGSSSTFTTGATAILALDNSGNHVRVQSLFPGTNTSITADSVLTSAIFGAELTIDDTSDNSDYTTATLPTPTQNGVVVYIACIGTVVDGDDGCVIQRSSSTTIGLGGATTYTMSAGETKMFRFNLTANRWTIY